MSVPNSFSLTLSNLYLPGLGEGGRHLNNREIGTHCLKQVITGSILNNRTNRSNKKESTNYYLSGIPAKNCRKQSDRTRLRDTLQKKKKKSWTLQNCQCQCHLSFPILKEIKEIWQLNVTHDPWLYPGFLKSKRRTFL